MRNYHFQAELNLLHELAKEFAKANPALAPLLDGNRTDPDVERLLEAVAYNNAMLRRKLDGHFPELVQQLAQLLLPHYLRPIPATTVIGFSSQAERGEAATIPNGTQFDSAPVEGITCRFTTTADLDLQPLELIDASFSPQSQQAGEIRLSLALKGLSLRHWQPRRLRLFLSGDYSGATDLYLLLSRHVTRIILAPADGGAPYSLPDGCLTPTGFGEEEALFPYPPHAFPGYRLLQEYFSSAEKFLFLDVSGWEQWQQRGEGKLFSIIFQLDNLPFRPQRIRCESFALHAVPAVNLFSHDAEPISVDHRAGSHVIRPVGSNPAHCQVFSVDRVTAYSRTTAREGSYVPFELFSWGSNGKPVYQTQLAESVRHDCYHVRLGVAYPDQSRAPESETLSITLTCTNGSLPDHLRIGEIATPLSALPEFVSARNIMPVNPSQPPPIGPRLLRQLISHLCLNHLSLERPEHLRALLELYAFPNQTCGARAAANLKRISGIETLQVTESEEMIAGTPIRGREIRFKLRQDCFAGPGDLYLFGCVLDAFLGCYASLQSYTQVVIEETLRGGTYRWPTRLGNRCIR